MCIGETRRFAPGQVTPHAAEKFTSATVIATLGMEDWQICQDAGKLAAELVAKVADRVTEVTVVLHRDAVEVVVAGGGAYERETAFARRPFDTVVECDLP